MNEISFLLYRFVLFPISFLILQIIRPFLNEKIQNTIKEKNKAHFKLRGDFKDWMRLTSDMNPRPFWIHASSGEIEYAKPVIKELKKLFPERMILVTYSSPSAKLFLTKLETIDAWGPLPWDSPFFIKSFLKKWNPDFLLVAKTDLWPEMAEQCRIYKLPILLFSATFAENSSRLKWLSKPLTQRSLRLCDKIFCVDEQDVETLKNKLNLTTGVVSGDTRFDQAVLRLKNPNPLKPLLKPSSDDFIFIMGSTWPEDEEILLPALIKLKDLSKYKFILAPHELTKAHHEKIINQCEELKIKTRLYSTASEWNSRELLIIDEFGLLAELYTWGSLAFVGGSFKKQVHSVMEPLAAGIPVLVGPQHKNNREAIQFQKIKVGEQQLSAVSVIYTSQDLINYLTHNKLENMNRVHEDIQTQILKRLGSTQRVIDWVQSHI